MPLSTSNRRTCFPLSSVIVMTRFASSFGFCRRFNVGSAALRADGSQLTVYMFRYYSPHGMPIRQVARDRGPRADAIGAFHQIRFVVSALPVVEHDEYGIGIARRGQHVGHVGPLRHAREL